MIQVNKGRGRENGGGVEMKGEEEEGGCRIMATATCPWPVMFFFNVNDIDLVMFLSYLVPTGKRPSSMCRLELCSCHLTMFVVSIVEDERKENNP